MPAKRKFCLSAVESHDDGEVDDILRYYEKYPDPNNLPRERDEIVAAAQQRKFFVIREASEIVAISGLFDLGDCDVEFGGTHVAEPCRGFGFQRLLFWVRVAAQIAADGDGRRLWSAIKPTNNGSIRGATRVGFEIATEPADVLVEPCARCETKPTPESVRVCCCDFYCLAFEQAARIVRELLSLADPHERTHRKTGEAIEIEVDVRVTKLPEYRDDLQDFADGLLGERK